MANADPPDVKSSSVATASEVTGSEVTFDIVCNSCENDGEIKEAEEYCVDCKEHLCATCLKWHRKISTSKHHLIVDSNSVTESQGASTVKDICTQRCKTHKEELIKYYCPTHETLICGVCMIRSHDTCKGKLYIPDEAKDLEDTIEFKDFQTLIETLTKKSERIIQSSNTNLKYSSNCRVNVLQEIESFRQEMNDALDKLKTAFDDQTEEIATRDTTLMNSVSNQISQVQAELRRMSSGFNDLLSNKHYCQMFVEMKNTKAKLVRIQKLLEEAEPSCITAFSFNPNVGLRSLVRKRDAFGKLLAKNPNKITATHVGDINIKSSGNNAVSDVLGAAILSKNKLVIISYKNKVVKLIDTETQRIVEYKPEATPHSVARISDKKVAVTLPSVKKILLILCSRDTLKPDLEINVDQECWHVTCYDDKLFVSLNVPAELRILNLDGEKLQSFYVTNQGEPRFSIPPHMTVGAFRQTLYVSEWDDSRLTMLDLDGNIISEYKDEDLVNPDGSAVDEMGLVYVCGVNSHNIHLLTPHCSKVKILLTEKDGIKFPRCVCYCRETRRLYVGMSRSDIVKVYQLS